MDTPLRPRLLLGALFSAFFAFYFLNSEWIYNYSGWVDGWAYFGGIYNPIHMRHVYPGHPLGDLLPLLLPGGLFYHLFDPFLANLLLKLAGFMASGFLLFRIVEREFGTRSALFTAILFLASKDFLAALGNDYTTGRVILYLLLTIYFVLRAPDFDLRKERINLCLGGAAFALSVSTALLSVVYGPALAVLYLGKRFQKTRRLDRDVLLNVGTFVSGSLLSVVALCLMHTVYTGQFLYFRNTLIKASSFLNAQRASPVIDFTQDWLALPLYLLLATPLVSHNWGRARSGLTQKAKTYSLALGTSFAALIYLQIFRKQGTVSDFYYFNQTLPFTYLVLAGVFFHPWIESLSARGFRIGTAALVGFSLAGFWFTTRYEQREIFLARVFFHNACIFTGLVLFLLYKGRPKLSIAVLSTFVFLLNLSPNSGDQIHRDFRVTARVPNREMALQLAVDWIKLMDRLDPGRSAWLWYWTPPVIGGLESGLAAASHYWQGRVYNDAFPLTNQVLGETGVLAPSRLTEQRLLVMTGSDLLLQTGVENLRRVGIQANCKKLDDFISQGRIFFAVYGCQCVKL